MRSVLKSVALIVGVSAALLLSAAPSRAARWNGDPTRVSVYNFNIHKMEDRWRAWVRWIERQDAHRPDVLLVQDMEDRAERQLFQDFLEATWGGTWSGLGGVSGAGGWHTAVIWRTERFDALKSRGWWGYGDATKDANATCTDEADGQDSPNGSPAVQVRLFDKIAEKYVSAVSFKTPGAAPDDCPWKNTRKFHFKLKEKGWSGRLLLVGTDANSRDWDKTGDNTGEYRCWYRGTNGDLGGNGCGDTENANQGFRDPIYQMCGGQRTCLDNNRTHGTSRIDYIFTKLGDGSLPQTSNSLTLPAGVRDGKFSDHRAIRSLISY